MPGPQPSLLVVASVANALRVPVTDPGVWTAGVTKGAVARFLRDGAWPCGARLESPVGRRWQTL